MLARLILVIVALNACVGVVTATPRTLNVYKNGSYKVGWTIPADRNFEKFKERAGEVLHLKAEHVFSEDGQELHGLEELDDASVVFLSEGSEFVAASLNDDPLLHGYCDWEYCYPFGAP